MASSSTSVVFRCIEEGIGLVVAGYIIAECGPILLLIWLLWLLTESSIVILFIRAYALWRCERKTLVLCVILLSVCTSITGSGLTNRHYVQCMYSFGLYYAGVFLNSVEGNGELIPLQSNPLRMFFSVQYPRFSWRLRNILRTPSLLDSLPCPYSDGNRCVPSFTRDLWFS